jgi:hypothetical protein
VSAAKTVSLTVDTTSDLKAFLTRVIERALAPNRTNAGCPFCGQLLQAEQFGPAYWLPTHYVALDGAHMRCQGTGRRAS